METYKQTNKETLVSTCRILGVNRQVYYRKKRAKNKQQETALKVITMVVDIRKQMPRIGTRKLYYLLSDQLQELGIGRDKLFAILNANHLCIKPKRSYHVTTNSHHRFRKHKNLITDKLLTRPEEVWVSDITYLGSSNNHSYLALITDAYSKKIVGYDVSNSLSVDGTINALKMAIKNRKYKKENLIHHSDRGIQYCSNEYQKLLKRHQITCSMTESYDPYANAVAERVNGILKDEFNLEQYNVNLVTMKKLVKDSIYIYNVKRPHYSCNLLTPERMHQQNIVKIKTYKKTETFMFKHESLY